MSYGPPPLPSSATSWESNSFARQAANVCLAAPLVTLALGYVLSVLHRTNHEAIPRQVFLIFGFVSVGFVAVGVLSGLLAIVTAKAGERASVVLRAGGGLVSVGLRAASAVPNFVRARTLALQDQAALQDIRAVSSDLRARAVASLNSSHPQPVDAQPLQQSLDRAAAKTSGDTAAMLKGTSAYLQRLQFYKTAYEQALRELTSAKVLTTRTLVQRDQIQGRKAIVTKFMRANDDVKAYVSQGETNYRKELASFQMSATEREAAIRGFRQSFGAQVPLLLEIRNADDRMGNAMLGVLSLLDDNWDRWRFDDNTGKVRFEDNAAVNQFNAFMTQIRQAAADQAAAQKRLAAAMSQVSPTV